MVLPPPIAPINYGPHYPQGNTREHTISILNVVRLGQNTCWCNSLCSSNPLFLGSVLTQWLYTNQVGRPEHTRERCWQKPQEPPI